MKKLKYCIVICILIILISACTSNSSDSNVNDNKNVLVYGSGDYTNINPAIYEHGEINSLIFSGLTAHDENNKIVPALAESWSFDDVTNTYTFNLRQNVKWHDGQPFTSKDVKFTIETILNPENMSEIASNYEDIENIEIVDDITVKIKLSSPNVAILDYLSVGMIPEHILNGKDILTDSFNTNPIGTGPYILKAWDEGQSITLNKNPDYYLGQPKIDTVIFKIVEDTKARALQLKSGELDIAQITPHDIEQFKNDSNFKLYTMKTSDYRGIMYNFNNPLFRDNRELPNALSYAIDRQSIIDAVLLGYGQKAYSPLQAGDYNNPNIEKFEYNPAKAKEELEKAGWKKGNDGIYQKGTQKLEFAVNCSEGDQVRIDIANICAQQFKEIGADVTVKISPQIDWNNQQAYLIGWGSPFDPDDHTYKVFGTDKGSNFNSYSNSKVDELLQKARQTDNDSERLEYYKLFQEELIKDMPYTFISYVDAIYVSKNNISGITDNKVLGHHGVGIFWNISDWNIE